MTNVRFITDGMAGASIDARTLAPEFKPATKAHGNDDKTYVYGVASGDIPVDASCIITNGIITAGIGPWRNPGRPFADGEYGWIEESPFESPVGRMQRATSITVNPGDAIDEYEGGFYRSLTANAVAGTFAFPVAGIYFIDFFLEGGVVSPNQTLIFNFRVNGSIVITSESVQSGGSDRDISVFESGLIPMQADDVLSVDMDPTSTGAITAEQYRLSAEWSTNREGVTFF